MLTIALVNLKPGTGKTTSAVHLAFAFHESLSNVLLIDADPAASALEWADIAGGFPFRIAGLPARGLGDRITKLARSDGVVIIDAPPGEDHAGTAQAAMNAADEILIPCAPTGIEVNRTAPLSRQIRQTGHRAAILLNRTVANANSTANAKAALSELGFDVLRTTVPRLEMFAQSFGAAPVTEGMVTWRNVARELTRRAAKTRMVRA